MGRRIDNSDRAALFTVEAGRRIAAAVAKVEAGDRAIAGARLRTAYGDDEPVRLCKTTAAWAFNTAATLDIWETGDPLDEQLTVQGEATLTLLAYNKLFDVAACVWVLVAQALNGEWYLITVPGYDSAKSQALTHDASGCLAWVDIESCT